MSAAPSAPDAVMPTTLATEVAIVIVNYCTPELSVDCLRSLAADVATSPRFEVVVSDNASPDGSAKKIQDAIAENGWSDWARVLALPKNGGFAYGNNAGMHDFLARAVPPRYVWLLNSDTVVRPGALRALVDFLDHNPAVGIAGSRLEDPDGTPQSCAFRFHSIAGEFEGSARMGPVTRLLSRWAVAPPIPDVAGRWDWLSGASMLIRRELFQTVGLLDETYFLYYEESDFCLRANRQGWLCWHVPASRVVHLVGKSTGVTERLGRPKRRPAYWFESRRRYFVKNYGVLYATAADLALAAGTILWKIRSALEGRQSTCPEKFLADLARHSLGFKATAGALSK